MGVKRERILVFKSFENQKGQSVVEFLVTIPMVIALILLMVRVNSAIQASIVNQQYSRGQILSLAFNSATYPYLDFRVANLNKTGFNQLILGVSETAPPDNNSTGTPFVPDAQIQDIGNKNVNGSDEIKAQPDQRSKIRIRNTVTLCTQTDVVADQTGTFKPLIPLAGSPAIAQGPGLLNEGTTFAYCRAPGGIY